MTESHEFLVRVEFDVEVENDSHIDAAFAGAEWLKKRARAGRFDRLVYQTTKHGESRVCETDLEEIVEISLGANEGKEPLPEDNIRSHELFDSLEQLLAEVKEHRPDDLIAMFYRLASAIEEAKFPELIFDEAAATFTCPYCEGELARDNPDDDLYWIDDLTFYDWDTAGYGAELIEQDDGGWLISAANDQPADWGSLYIQHACGGAVSIPTNIHIEAA